MDNIFIKIVGFFEIINDRNELCIDNIKDGTLEMDFLHFVMDLIIDGRVPVCLEYAIDAKLHVILKDNLQDDVINKLFVIKHLASAIQTRNFDTIEELCDYTCTGQTRSELYEKWEIFKKVLN